MVFLLYCSEECQDYVYHKRECDKYLDIVDAIVHERKVMESPDVWVKYEAQKVDGAYILVPCYLHAFLWVYYHICRYSLFARGSSLLFDLFLLH